MKGKRKEPENKEVRARINQQIRCDEVRLIDADGAQVGVMSPREALVRAEESGLDLVEVSPTAKPPVCRIMDYGKYRYELSKKQQEAKKKQTVVEVKEIKLRPKTEKHDLDFKIKNIKKFLQQKNKVKVTLRFRGREIVYADTIGREVLERIGAELLEDGVILQTPKMEGRQMTMLVGPK
ncbi:MAG TPA: translation initiation factor IF-3 [Desulfurivibrio alkaliphilus]|uniref:Translation initiation factor IF-3 n=1 Tax=Desulfurivibrio alkaliphilus TaxID=427923 RepID=A0A7C2XZ10_9BACT|nr:translation initiation factor IF-3 [Desulfurivibrio alkaliphilus]